MDKTVLLKGDYGIIFTDGTGKKEMSDQGFIFKSTAMFESELGVCYIPELSGEGNNGSGEILDISKNQIYFKKDFLDLVDGNEHLARILFEVVDWQHPSSLLEDLKGDEVFGQELKDWTIIVDEIHKSKPSEVLGLEREVIIKLLNNNSKISNSLAEDICNLYDKSNNRYNEYVNYIDAINLVIYVLNYDKK